MFKTSLSYKQKHSTGDRNSTTSSPLGDVTLQNHIPHWQSACRGFLHRSVHAWCSQTTFPARLPAVDEEARVPSLGWNRSSAAAERLWHTCKLGWCTFHLRSCHTLMLGTPLAVCSQLQRIGPGYMTMGADGSIATLKLGFMLFSELYDNLCFVKIPSLLGTYCIYIYSVKVKTQHTY